MDSDCGLQEFGLLPVPRSPVKQDDGGSASLHTLQLGNLGAKLFVNNNLILQAMGPTQGAESERGVLMSCLNGGKA